MLSLKEEIHKRDPFESVEHEAILSIMRTADVLARPAFGLLTKFSLSPAQYNVLRILRGVGGDGLPCGQITQHMLTREPDMTRLLDRLQRRELITRCRPESDRRVVRARLTPAALSLLAEIDEPLMQLVRSQLAHMESQQLSTLIQLLALARGGPTIDCPLEKEGSI